MDNVGKEAFVTADPLAALSLGILCRGQGHLKFSRRTQNNATRIPRITSRQVPELFERSRSADFRPAAPVSQAVCTQNYSCVWAPWALTPHDIRTHPHHQNIYKFHPILGSHCHISLSGAQCSHQPVLEALSVSLAKAPNLPQPELMPPVPLPHIHL
jgi:hypothetical protein